MIKSWHDDAWEDYVYWQGEDRKTLKKINKLLSDIERNGESKGIGKPEPLSENLSGCSNDSTFLMFLIDIYNSKLFSCNRKSYTLIMVIPFSSLRTLMISFTTIIFLNESFTFIRDAFSCLILSASGKLYAD